MSADGPGSSEPHVVLVHIPRTGGGTVKVALGRNYGSARSPGNAQSSPEATRAKVQQLARRSATWRVAADHVPLGLFERYLPDDTRYLTILRDPVDRVLSHHALQSSAGGRQSRALLWQHLATVERRLHGLQPDGENVRFDEHADYSLEEGLRRRIRVYDNLQTRFLWGGETLFGELPPDALERAKENLSRLWFVGVTERLDEAIVVLGRRLGIGLMPYQLMHASSSPTATAELPPGLRELIAEYNSLDVELHRFASERFAAEAPPGDELRAAAEELRAKSSGPPDENDRRMRRRARTRGTGRKRPGPDAVIGSEDPRSAEAEVLERLRAVEDRLYRLEKLVMDEIERRGGVDV